METSTIPYGNFREHLEYLGYTITEILSENKTISSLKATHPRRTNFRIIELRGGILLVAFFGIQPTAKDDLLGKLQLVNTLNRGASAARASVDKEGDIVVEAWFPQTYVRSDFGLFIDNFENDITSGFTADSELSRRILT